MSTSTYEQLVEDLTRDVHRAQPRDPLQYCANWFQSRLEEQRTRFRDVATDRSPNLAAQRRDLYDEWSPAGPPPGPAANSPSPRQSLDPAPFLKNPFGAQSALNTFSPAPSSFSGGPGAARPFVTINEGEVLSPSAFTLPFAGPFALSPPTADTSGNTLALPPGLLGRRTSVSAESIVPGSQSSEAVPFHPKTPEQLKRIKAAIRDNFIFRDIEEKQLQAVLGAMEEVHVVSNEVVIRQGDHGDYFYVVEDGTLLCYVATQGRQPPEVSDAYHPEFGKKVADYGPGSSFGELALMYGHPRAASIIASKPSTLWRLDRISFRTIILKAAHTRRTMYEEFLGSVPVLKSLSPEERSKIADVLGSRVYEGGEDVVVEGEMGDTFYLVEEGEAVALKKNPDGSDEMVVKEYQKGDYFGGNVDFSSFHCVHQLMSFTFRSFRTRPLEHRTPSRDRPR
jgi:cAMP-dependent protein kinase regulator